MLHTEFSNAVREAIGDRLDPEYIGLRIEHSAVTFKEGKVTIEDKLGRQITVDEDHAPAMFADLMVRTAPERMRESGTIEGTPGGAGSHYEALQAAVQGHGPQGHDASTPAGRRRAERYDPVAAGKALAAEQKAQSQHKDLAFR